MVEFFFEMIFNTMAYLYFHSAAEAQMTVDADCNKGVEDGGSADLSNF